MSSALHHYLECSAALGYLKPVQAISHIVNLMKLSLLDPTPSKIIHSLLAYLPVSSVGHQLPMKENWSKAAEFFNFEHSFLDYELSGIASKAQPSSHDSLGEIVGTSLIWQGYQL